MGASVAGCYGSAGAQGTGPSSSEMLGQSSDAYGGSQATPISSADRFQTLPARISGHRFTVRVSPLVRISKDATALALQITRAEDDASVTDVKEDFTSSENAVPVSTYLANNALADHPRGASGTRLLDPATSRVWNSTQASTGRALMLAPGETGTTYVPFGAVDINQVTVLVPQTGFVTVRVIGRDAAESAGVDLVALDTELGDITINAALGAPVRVERPAVANPNARPPAPSGPTARGADGVTVKANRPKQKGTITLRLGHLTRSGGLLWGELVVVAGKNGTGAPLGAWLNDDSTPATKGETSGAVGIADGLMLVAGTQRIAPASYIRPGDNARTLLTERVLVDVLKEGAATTVCVAWPDTGQETVILDHARAGGPAEWNYPFRLTDIPVR